MIQSLFLLSPLGEVLIEKHYRSVTPRSVCDAFWSEVNKYESKLDVPPVIITGSHYIFSILRGDMWLVAMLSAETSTLLVFEFLHRVADIFVEYFGELDELVVKDNFATIYQLLEEMMDFGYPLTTEPNALRSMIEPPTVISRLTAATTGKSGVSDVLPTGTISNMPWRKTDVKYSQNEIYVDIIEEVDTILDRNGKIVSSEVSGTIVSNCRLSGVPDLALTFADPSVVDDCSFHPCVRYNRFERDKVVSFVPPDGHFELMRYRPNISGRTIVPPLFCQPQVSMESGGGHQAHVSVTIGVRSDTSLVIPNRTMGSPLVVEDVVVHIPFSKSVRTVNLVATAGTVLYDEVTKIAKWTVGKFGLDKRPQVSGTVLRHTPGSEACCVLPLEIQWKLPTASVSGLAISSLQLNNESYKPYKGMRTLSQAGKFIVRCTV
ncbi:unnamed protein product [Ectocarpus fasciculatus]